MRAENIKYLLCPNSGSPLKIDSGFDVIEHEGRVVEAMLVEASGRHQYPVVATIPLLLQEWILPDVENEAILLDCSPGRLHDWIREHRLKKSSGDARSLHGHTSQDQIARSPGRHNWFDLADIYTDVQYAEDYLLPMAEAHLRESIVTAFGRNNFGFYDQVQSLVALHTVDNQNVLDVGCATGCSAFRLAARGANVLAVDISYSMLRRATHLRDSGQDYFRFDRTYEGRKKIAREVDIAWCRHQLVDFVLGDASNLPLAAGSFSIVASVNLVDAVDKPAGVLKEMCRVADNRSLCILTSPYSWATISRARQEDWLQEESDERPSRAAITAAFKKHGFKLARWHDAVPWKIQWDHRDISLYMVDCLAYTRTRDTARSM